LIQTAPFIRLRGVAGPQNVAGTLLDRFSEIQCVMLMLAVIWGSFDHEVAVNVLRGLSSFWVQIRHTHGHTTVSLYPLCVSIVSTCMCCTCKQWYSSTYRKHTHTHTHTHTQWRTYPDGKRTDTINNKQTTTVKTQLYKIMTQW